MGSHDKLDLIVKKYHPKGGREFYKGGEEGKEML
jgi:hypothetical protein